MVCEDTNHGKQRRKKAPEERNIPRNIIDIKFSSSGAAQMIKVCEDMYISKWMYRVSHPPPN
jgi:hypothetical protein